MFFFFILLLTNDFVFFYSLSTLLGLLKAEIYFEMTGRGIFSAILIICLHFKQSYCMSIFFLYIFVIWTVCGRIIENNFILCIIINCALYNSQISVSEVASHFSQEKQNKIHNKTKSTTHNKKSLTNCHVCKNWILLRTTVLHSSSLKLQSLDSGYKILFFKVLQMSSTIKLYSVHNLRNGICINFKNLPPLYCN